MCQRPLSLVTRAIHPHRVLPQEYSQFSALSLDRSMRMKSLTTTSTLSESQTLLLEFMSKCLFVRGVKIDGLELK